MNNADVSYYLDLYKKEEREIFDSISDAAIVKLVNLIFEAYKDERTIFAAGNGGSISYIQNMVADFNLHVFTSEDKQSRTIKRNNFKCVNLSSDPAVLIGLANDLGLESIYREQLMFQGQKEDLFFGISGSGNSKNIVEAMKTAKEKGMKNILFTRNAVNRCNEYADLIICPEMDIVSHFPGQTGPNNNNFYLEDLVSKLTHICVGLLKLKVQNEN